MWCQTLKIVWLLGSGWEEEEEEEELFGESAGSLSLCTTDLVTAKSAQSGKSSWVVRTVEECCCHEKRKEEENAKRCDKRAAKARQTKILQSLLLCDFWIAILGGIFRGTSR